MSTLFLRTLREDPADAEVPSHKLMVRGGYVRRAAPGIYSWMPLGKIVLDNVAAVIREEMNRIGGQEMLLPTLLPSEYYEATGRWTEYGDALFRLRDRKGGDYALTPTHEELFTWLVKGEFTSYKDFPVILYQVQEKFRDEARPRAGVLRGREFHMKDSYSFDLDDEGLKHSYELHRQAYIRIFDRLGLRFVAVSAQSGAMGGSASEEFLAETPTGEDTFVRSTASDYAANVEAVDTPAPPAASVEGLAEAQVHHTPDTPTIETLVDFFNAAGLGRTFTAADTLKNVLVKTRAPGADDWEVTGIGVPGDREVDMKRLEAAFHPAEVQLLDDADFAAHPFLVKGYVGPNGLLSNKLRYLVDPRVAEGTSWLTGADKADHHVLDLVCGRDFVPDGTIEAAEVREGDPSPDGRGTLYPARGIEIGHIFQLGRKYTDAFELDALGADGKPKRVTMGSYGIGVSRVVAAVVEQSHDGKGIVWPREIAPADVHVVGTGKGEQIEVALRLAEELEQRGVRVLVDDRKGVSPGVKFTDAELLGVPTSLIVGKGLADGSLELRDRASGESMEIALEGAADRVASAVAAG
ncbi:proline--tRNA ligase [Streptomonospora wellingtoniae]|uniref:Proline--tRNA ligase n=1 Tax=Streptomonospora wellingtoniae TaxID=3075544 RepID=A0ABU2KQR5_9ACTN|nr:proline--tRNA ligase [Streptomonospora sp. DSM 45055]MDT0301463.1 proline--tRNA ligase [Streptomonospora sp. DSM 45055]